MRGTATSPAPLRWDAFAELGDETRRSLEVIAQQWDHALMKLKLAVER